MTFAYHTPRLFVQEVLSGVPEPELLIEITELLTAKVAEYLPPNFKNINSVSDAQQWFSQMVSESRLFIVKHQESNTAIGFVFVFVENDVDAHIGYLLGESYWGKGYATELLTGLIDYVVKENKLSRLIAGVDVTNPVSSKLLLKLGFIQQASENKEMLFYQYLLAGDYK